MVEELKADCGGVEIERNEPKNGALKNIASERSRRREMMWNGNGHVRDDQHKVNH